MSPGQGCGCGSFPRPFICEQGKGLFGQERLTGGAPGPGESDRLQEPLLCLLWFAVNNGAESHRPHLSPVWLTAACGSRQGGLESWPGGTTQPLLPQG